MYKCKYKFKYKYSRHVQSKVWAVHGKGGEVSGGLPRMKYCTASRANASYSKTLKTVHTPLHSNPMHHIASYFKTLKTVHTHLHSNPQCIILHHILKHWHCATLHSNPMHHILKHSWCVFTDSKFICKSIALVRVSWCKKMDLQMQFASNPNKPNSWGFNREERSNAASQADRLSTTCELL